MPHKENNFKPRILETQFFFILLGLLVGIKILTLLSFWSNLGATIFNQVSQDDLYALTNEARVSSGVGKLQVSSRLEAVAQLKLADMFQNNYFAHTSPVGVNPWYWFDKANYDFRLAGENLAMNFMSSNEILNAWLNSESHKKNLLLNDFQETGIAVGSGIINNQQTVVVVQVFGMPKTPVLAVQAKPISKIMPNIVSKPSLAPQTAPRIKADPISLKKTAVVVPQVKSALEEKYFLPEYLSYFANDSFQKMAIIFVVMIALILFLKVFVAFRVQFPALIFRAVLLIVLGLAFVLIKNESFMLNKIKIIDKAEMIILNEK